jgi:protein-disulfide isomerase
MAQKKDKALIFAVSFSSAAISASLVFFGMQMGGSTGVGLSDDALQAQIIEGIETYVGQQQEDYEKQQEEVAEIPAFPEIDFDFDDDDALLGDEDAPILIVEFSDYQCPYCAKFANDTLPLIKEKYIDTGKVKFMYRDFPIPSHSQAYPAALLAECVRDQGGDSAYFEVHDYIFANKYDYDAIVDLALGLGVDEGELTECFENDTFKDEIENDMDDARNLLLPSEVKAGKGIGTPSFSVGGIRVRGAQPFEVFEQIIEAQLAE